MERLIEVVIGRDKDGFFACLSSRSDGQRGMVEDKNADKLCRKMAKMVGKKLKQINTFPLPKPTEKSRIIKPSDVVPNGIITPPTPSGNIIKPL